MHGSVLEAALAYSPDKAGESLGVGRTLIYELIGAGTLDARKVGKRTLVTRESLARYLASAPRAVIRMNRRAA